MVVKEAALAAYSIALKGVRKQHLWYDVPSRMRDFTRANASHVASLEGMAFWTPFTVATCAPVADYMLIVNATMLALSWVGEFLPEAAAMGAALEYVQRRQLQLPATDERSIVVREVERRLQQLRAAVTARASEYDTEKAAFAARLQRELEPQPMPARPGGGEIF